MKYYKKFKKTFGINEFGLIDFPRKFSNVKISRIQNTDNRCGCTWCFPHCIETTNSKQSKFTRNWKSYRRAQYKTKKCV